MFWPDLAAASYAQETKRVLNESKIHVVEREGNPSNLPQQRPIEDFWGAGEAKVYRGGWEARSDEQLMCRIRTIIASPDEEVP